MRQFGRRNDTPPVPGSHGPGGAPAIGAVSDDRSGTVPSEAPEPDAMASLAMGAREARLMRLRTLVMEKVDPVVASELPPDKLKDQLEVLVHEVADRERLELSAKEEAQLAEDLTHDMVGYGPLEPLLRDDTVSDILVNGPFKVYVMAAGKMRRTDVRFRDAAQVATIAQKMAAGVGRRIDESSPIVDCRLPDGSRVNAIFPPVALDGPYISIRKFSKKKLDFGAMVSNGSMDARVARILEIAARCQLNILISGGTGSGKTTLLNALSRLIDPGERVLTIEDAAELQLQQDHVLRMETRPANLEGKGEIAQRKLVEASLRMMPTRIIVGEVRGGEAFDMLQAMNTGHDGSICTIHANTTRDALTRLENMVQMGNYGMTVRGIRFMISSALDLVIQIQRMRDGVRRVTQISEVVGMEGEVVTMNDIFSFEFDGEDASGRIVGRYVAAPARPGFAEKLRYFGLDRAWMAALEEG